MNRLQLHTLGFFHHETPFQPAKEMSRAYAFDGNKITFKISYFVL